MLPNPSTHPYVVDLQDFTTTVHLHHCTTFSGALIAFAAERKRRPKADLSVINYDNVDLDQPTGLSDWEGDAVAKAEVLVSNGRLVPQIEALDIYEMTARIEIGARFVRVSYFTDPGDRRILDLDGSECIESFDSTEAPEGATVDPENEGCSLFPALLDDRERSAIEEALIFAVEAAWNEAAV